MYPTEDNSFLAIEPPQLQCVCCESIFNSAWLLCQHCQILHQMKLYKLPSVDKTQTDEAITKTDVLCTSQEKIPSQSKTKVDATTQYCAEHIESKKEALQKEDQKLDVAFNAIRGYKNKIDNKSEDDYVADDDDDEEGEVVHKIKSTKRKAPKKSVCMHCGKRFQFLKRHMQTVHKKEHRCDVCDKKFSGGQALKLHLMRHKGDFPYKCDICNMKFVRKNDLIRHNLIHTGEKPYKCQICGKGFTQTGSLKVHGRSHTGEKRFSCEQCGMVFSTSSNLIKHIKRHKDDRPYVCDVCGTRFKQNCDLKRHKKAHSGEKPWACKVCSKTFRDRGGLNVHFRTHTGEKPYICEHCGKRFAQRGDVKKHVKIHHLAERAHECLKCGLTFSYKNELQKHASVHTNPNANPPSNASLAHATLNTPRSNLSRDNIVADNQDYKSNLPASNYDSLPVPHLHIYGPHVVANGPNHDVPNRTLENHPNSNRITLNSSTGKESQYSANSLVPSQRSFPVSSDQYVNMMAMQFAFDSISSNVNQTTNN